MMNKLSAPPRKGKRTSKLIERLMVPMLLLALLQTVTFFGILIVGGEFTYIEQYSYGTLVEKTENRRNYIESDLLQKAPFVLESAEKINSKIAEVLKADGQTTADLQTDRELNRRVMEASVDGMIELLRRSMVNDVYLILDTGDLYAGDGGSIAKGALYLRDLDVMTDAGYEDLLMEIGLTSISQKYGIILDSGWALHFEPDMNDAENYDYYFKTIQTAKDNPEQTLDNLGYWSGFSKLSRGTAASMKYTVPLIASDGTVYGVLGIGLTSNSILSILPANDFMNETACYVLGQRRSSNKFDIVARSGSAFNRLLGDADILEVLDELQENVSSFATTEEITLVGSVQNVNLYGEDSPYASEQWALISVADRSSVLSPLTNLMRMLAIATAVSLGVSVIVALLSSRAIVQPMSKAIKAMSADQEFNHVIRFEPSNIYELDKMTEAITQLQINVQDFSSQVSQMIRIANVGLGTFMYDRSDDTVFVAQSLLNQLRNQQGRNEDVKMDREDFLNDLVSEEIRNAVTDGLAFAPYSDQTEYSREFSVVQEDGSEAWMRLSLVHNTNKSIGILQDITDAMMEKKRIEYERDYDGTTGLLNRRAYYQRLEELFHEPDELKVTAIVMLDLDNLKYVNDTYGHDFGDDYIKTAATALKKFQAYGGVVSRLSGDEFNVCLPGFSSKEQVREIIYEVRSQLLQSSCLLADGTHFKIRASMGIAWYPDDAKSYEALMKYADFAMYTIKHSKKGEVAEFNMETYTADSVLLTGVEEMNRIIEERRVRYAFQGIVAAKTGKVFGYEALMRPQSSIFQSKLELLRTAKTGAKLYEIERLTWIKALEDFRGQIDAGHIADDSRVFINSITNCVLEPSDVEMIEEMHGNLLSRVVVEVLESESNNTEYMVRKLGRVRKWNAQVALDDFGISFNNDFILTTIQPNLIKIDRSIINGCDKDVSRRSIINNLVKLAHSRDIRVLAGGVETEDELKTVISCGVDLLQGYYLCRPLFEPEPLDAQVVDKIRALAAEASHHLL